VSEGKRVWVRVTWVIETLVKKHYRHLSLFNLNRHLSGFQTDIVLSVG